MLAHFNLIAHVRMMGEEINTTVKETLPAKVIAFLKSDIVIAGCILTCCAIAAVAYSQAQLSTHNP